MHIVGKGGANILLDYDDPVYLYRCCVKFPESVKLNNRYVNENYKFIREKVLPLLGDYVCPMEQCSIPLGNIYPVYSQYVNDTEADMTSRVEVLKIPNLRPSSRFTMILKSDHLTKIYSNDTRTNILLEIKPKWLHNPYHYCRNCTHNDFKGREIKYCYSRLLNDPTHLYDILMDVTSSLPRNFVDVMLEYLRNDSNILRRLHDIQKSLSRKELRYEIDCIAAVTEDLQLLMTLRDVTCFIEWDVLTTDLKINVVDVDLKLKDKWTHWNKTNKSLDTHQEKHYHD
ncbi:hypothetical protein KAFR_0K02240 [Kazachstania africana CBS 2517]|uniref:Inositol-pentakisphosphate 2-kinase n=1 Tax=Kazachstania africana (strain ATCC 22294 / BCRC 22015 / CBS 2517 / CECT 1963 / NBRC 1671 / NRRL Y-8276) TaxID=1071382 RepID=H2B1S8_KAZAF|nr:hypothetical protein KAFR_0K02240 [Kazachstania africana CBS 2517]CCF60578.1 hypothetical protein KAFR_0K02240 [Kazachstania africana CBS 2517]